MKFLVGFILLSPLIVDAQWNQTGSRMADIKEEFALVHEEFEYSESVTESGQKSISYDRKEKKFDEVIRLLYFFNSNNICCDSYMIYDNELLILMVKRLNSDYIKAGRLKWISQEGDQSYEIEGGERFFTVHVSLTSENK